jgi:hypothetical protein
MAVTLTPAQINRVVSQAWFVFDVRPNVTDTSGTSIAGFYGTGNLYSGEGSKTIAYLQTQLANWPRVTLKLDVPVDLRPAVRGGNAPPASPPDSLDEGAIEGPALQAGDNFIPMTLDDVEALRQAFIAKWGDVVKPDYYARPQFD